MKVVDNVARAFAPAGVGKIGVGFDLLGHSIDGPRAVARVRRVAAPGVRITAITGDAAGADAIPLEVERNTAGQAMEDRKTGVQGKRVSVRVDIGGRRIIK